MTTSFSDREFPAVTELTRRQRRVLGVLVEKAFTTPEYYPLTLKAATGGCNQKSNRSPVSTNNEDDVLESLDELREMGLVSMVLPDSGRTERYRHWMRKRFTFSEPQLAIITELLLRGRQSLGELRSRASRMVPIESLDDLRRELTGLLEMQFVQASGSLNRRGIEVDHTFYQEREGKLLTAAPEEPEPRSAAPASAPPTRKPVPPADNGELHNRITQLESTCEELRQQNAESHAEIDDLKDKLRRIEDGLDTLKRDLGA